ncbi:hypothetical protein DFH28DRAFT_157198 [Melampsora americana]|nr:hypothetical protein DFH28DRAFT_157198 [Melampsora americana]
MSNKLPPSIYQKSIKSDLSIKSNSIFTQFNQSSNFSPISISTYMNLCLNHSSLGYYTDLSDLCGKSGNFITSPEISQIFGEVSHEEKDSLSI